MSGTSQGFGEHGAFTVSIGADPRLGDAIHEMTRKAAEMTGCSTADATSLADAVIVVARAVAGDVDLAYRPLLEALVIEIRAGHGGKGGALRHALGRGVFERVTALVPAAELQGTGADECCFLTCPRADDLR